MNIAKVFIVLALLTTFSGCRELSDMLGSGENVSKKDLPTVNREKPNLSSETAELDVDPDSDDLTEETETEPNSVDENSDDELATNDNSSVDTETDEDNTSGEQPNGVSSGSQTVTFNSFGNVRVGMTPAQASQVLGTEIVRGEGFEDSCYYSEPLQGFKGVSFMVTGGTIARIDTSSKAYITDKGLRIGDTEAKLESLYPGNQTNPNKYDERITEMEVYSEDEQFLMIFEIENGVVVGFRVGKAEEVGYVEGCN